MYTPTVDRDNDFLRRMGIRVCLLFHVKFVKMEPYVLRRTGISLFYGLFSSPCEHFSA